MATTDLVNLHGEKVSNDNQFGVDWELKGDGYACQIVMSPVNARIQIVSYDVQDFKLWLSDIKKLAQQNNFGKVWVKARTEDVEALKQQGMAEEGCIKGYFNGQSDAHVMALYIVQERSERPYIQDEDNCLEAASSDLTYFDKSKPIVLPNGYTSRVFREGDEVELAKLYSQVFPTYPYPIDEPAYLLETSKTHIIYRLVFNENGKLVAAASAETVPEYQNSEMTDFATLPSERGKGLAQYLLTNLENDAEEFYKIKCYYTIARISEPGMVRVFLKNHYNITGILTNNCSIAGQFETMVLLVKKD